MSGETILFREARTRFHQALLSTVLTCDARNIPSNADDGNGASVKIALLVAQKLGDTTIKPKVAGQTAGRVFERECRAFLQETFLSLQHLRPGKWSLLVLDQKNKRGISQFEQYAHLSSLAKAVVLSPELASILGNDYLITPDIVIFREPETDEDINRTETLVDQNVSMRSPLRKLSGSQPLIHASISCKWTLRSDRAQNARSEALNLIRNRKGRVPHIISITAEPLPSRLHH